MTTSLQTATGNVHIPFYDLDWTTGHIRADKLDRLVVEEKFKLWDYVVENDLAYSKEGLDLLEDDTIFAYANLTFNGLPVKMRYFQDAVMSDTHRIIDVEAANQQGKTFTLCVKAAVSFLRDHGKNWTIALVSRSKTQNGTNMRMIKQMLAQANIEWEAGDNDSQSVTTMDFEGGYTNTIICAVAGGGALGLPVDLLLLDEFEFWVEEADKSLKWYFDQIFYPRTFDTKGQIIIYSNPNGKNFVSEDLQLRMDADEKHYLCHTYNINYLDNPNNTREEWDNALKNVHPIIFASTMAAERTESEGAALKIGDIKKTYDEGLQDLGEEALHDRENLAFFADLGFVYDQTVLVGGYAVVEDNPLTKRTESIFYFVPKCYPVGHDVKELWGMADSDVTSIPKFTKRFSEHPYFEIDLTGKEGNEVLAQEAGMSCSGIKMSGPWKATHYERFISLCKQGRIKVFEQDNWIEGANKNFAHQASTLKITTKTSDGRNRPYPLYHHNTEQDHDDLCFVAGTLILTPDGKVPIETLKEGDLVITSKGPRPIEATLQRKAKVVSRLGLRGTPDHPIISNSRTIKLINTNESNQYYIWNEEQSCIMECRITDTLIQNGNTSEIIIGATLNGKLLPNPYTDKYGRMSSVQSQRSMSFITKMETLLTMPWTTLNVLLRKNTFRSTKLPKVVNKNDNTRQELDHSRKHGMQVNKAVNGIKNTPKRASLSMKIESVWNVVKHIVQKTFALNSVQTSVGQESMKEDDQKETVYNIKVKDCPNYFANNILVHNCDAIVGCLSMIDDEMANSGGASFLGRDGRKIEKEEPQAKIEEGVYYDDADATLKAQSMQTHNLW